MANAIKIAVIGGPGSGKTTLIERFVRHEFSNHTPVTCSTCEQFGKGSPIFEDGTASKLELPASLLQICKYKKRCICNRQRPVIKTVVYKDSDGRTRSSDLVLMDIPALTPFPQDTLQEFDMEGARGVTSASAYILVFDVTKRESYGFINRVRLEIKDFLRNSVVNTAASSGKRGIQEEDFTSSCNVTIKRSIRKNKEISSSISQYRSPSRRSTNDALTKNAEPVILIVGTKVDLFSSGIKDEDGIAWYKQTLHTIRKTWKYPYIECSAKYGYDVDKVFSTVIDAALVARGLRKMRKKTKGVKQRFERS